MKVPFTISETWTDGQSTVELSDGRVNDPIADARFRRPAPATAFKKFVTRVYRARR